MCVSMCALLLQSLLLLHIQNACHWALLHTPEAVQASMCVCVCVCVCNGWMVCVCVCAMDGWCVCV